MASKPSTIVGLDIGTNTTTVVVSEVLPDGKINILGVGTSPSRGLRKGVVINIEGTIESISQAVMQAEKMAGVEIHSIFASISGSHINGTSSHGIVGIRNREVGPQDVEKVIEAARAVNIPMDREILHVLPQEFIIDEQDGIREPIGISGVRLEAFVHIITGAVASGQNIVKCANRCGLSVQDIVFSALASAKAVLSPEEQELGACVIDIGAGTSDIAVYHSGAVKYTGVVPVGGNHITNDIAAGLRTPISAAEEIKCKHGAALASQISTSEAIDVPSTGGRSSRVLSKGVLAEIIEPRVLEMFTLLRTDIVRSGCYDYLTSGLVLTGGCASLAGITQAAEKVFNLPVRVGTPMGVGGITDLIKGPEYSCGVGLAIHGATNAAKVRSSTKMVAPVKLLKTVGNWFSSHF